MINHGKNNKTSKTNQIIDQLLLNTLSHNVVTDLEQLSATINEPEISVQDLIQRLNYFQGLGLEFETLTSKYCKLQYPLDRLNTELINTVIPDEVATIITAIDQFNIIDSTNTVLNKRNADEQHASVCIADYQTAGRGRHGRRWYAPFGAGLSLSLGWRFQTTIKQMQLISLLPAVAVIRVLRAIGLNNAYAKWPNDVLCNGRKLAGILIEIPANRSIFQTVVIGVGLNVYQRSESLEHIQQPWVTLDQQLEEVPSRNELAAMLITELINLLQSVESGGLAAVRDEWREYDALIDQPVCILRGRQREIGVSRGITDNGAISIEIDGVVKFFTSGEISVRAYE